MKEKILSLIAAIFMLTSCAKMYTQQPTNNIAFIDIGMNSKQVLEIMGVPAKTEFNDSSKILHYCKTGYNVDDFAVIRLVLDKVVAAKNYTLTPKDVNEESGDCRGFIKSVSLQESSIGKDG